MKHDPTTETEVETTVYFYEWLLHNPKTGPPFFIEIKSVGAQRNPNFENMITELKQPETVLPFRKFAWKLLASLPIPSTSVNLQVAAQKETT